MPLVIQEPRSAEVRASFTGSNHIIWWSTPLECESALCRRVREGEFTQTEARNIRNELERLRQGMLEVLPTPEVRRLGMEMLRVHTLRAADAAQLAAAEIWRRRSGETISFVCLDQRLRNAALTQGLVVLP